MTALGTVTAHPVIGAGAQVPIASQHVGGATSPYEAATLESPLVANALDVRSALRETIRVLRADWRRHYGEEMNLAATLPEQAPTRAEAAPRTQAERDAQASIAHGIACMRELSEQWERLLSDPEVAELLASASTARARVLRQAIALVRAVDGAEGEASMRGRSASPHAQATRLGPVDALVRHAARRSRPLTREEQATIAAAANHVTQARGSQSPAVRLGEGRPGMQLEAGEDHAVLDAVLQIRIRQARRELDAGLVLNEKMRELVAAATPAVLAGAPILLIGETGGAKTALAEYLAGLEGEAHEFVSGYGDITGAQIVGTHELRAEGDATVTEFAPGPLLRAMQRGVPIILDEINAMPPEFLKRLNRVLQLRPGSRFAVQEQPGLTIEIASGFVVLATANEYSPHRYRGIEPLSTELVNRFGSATFRVHYPDAGANIEDVPAENLLLAAAVVAGPDGSMPPGLGLAELTPLARAAFISQQVFVGNPDEALDRYRGTEHEFDEQPGLAETVIAPRTLAAVLEGVMLQGGASALTGAMERFVDGVMHTEDRAVLRLILAGQGLLR
ncbi:AAA family ATPase [Leucobacter aridicollis]|uniref:AAA family ATPase n=1 Tax=Leucobacter aridicollis TaxID=283878 RepID=UPI000E656F81|nr:AAA family ATPase [Leucobacter aridicollis]UTX52437.1 AAA family ATPase [Leucobacter aridicollis]